jgi:hypothetical protein
MMKEERYNIDLKETTKLGKILRIVLGIICLIATAWFLFTVRGTAASVTTAWIAIVFLFLFSLWLLGSGLGATDRYITVGDDRIILRQNFLKPPVVFTSTTLTHVEFRPLAIEFRTAGEKVILRLGTYYPGHSANVMEAIKKFCTDNGVEIKGLESEDNNNKS